MIGLTGFLVVMTLWARAWAAPEDELDRVEVRWLQAESELQEATARLRELDGRLREVDTRLRDREARLEERRARVATRLQVMYRLRRRGLLPYLFSAGSVHELLESMRSFAWILRGDEAELAAWERERQEYDELRATAQSDREEVLRLAGEAAARRDEGERLRDRRREIVRALPPERKQSVQRRWNDEAMPKLDFAMDLSAEATPAELPSTVGSSGSHFARSRGRLAMPAMGAVTRAGRGLAIAAPKGSVIRAVHPGHVERILWIQGYGLVAVLSHGDGWATVYGHAEAFSVHEGDDVQGGAPLGTVGDSGSIEGTRLHFEVRRDQVAQDPLEWLAVPAGISVSR